MFLTNRPFSPALVRVKSAIKAGEGALAQCAEVDKLCQHLAGYARKEKKDPALSPMLNIQACRRGVRLCEGCRWVTTRGAVIHRSEDCTSATRRS